MNMLKNDFETVEEGMKKLKDAISIRDKMGGALYYNILNDDCYEIAQKLVSIGAKRSEDFALLR